MVNFINKIISWCFLILVYGYRFLVRPILGYHCRFSPSCSSYALAALKQYSVLKALKLIFLRLIRCHPWQPGGDDPLPSNSLKRKGY